MHTTGIKENIINKIADITYDDTKEVLSVKNSGVFDVAKMSRVVIAAPIAERVAGPVATDPHQTITFAGAASADVIVVNVVFKSLKGAYADFSNTDVNGGKTLSASFSYVDATNAASRLAAVLKEAGTNYSIADADNSAGVTRVTFSDSSVFIDSITVKGEYNTTAVATATLATVLPATLGRNHADAMRDQVRVATNPNTNPESGYTLGQQVQEAGYYAISFAYNATNNLPGGVFNGVPTRNAEFIIYVNENIWTPSAAGTNPLDDFMNDLTAAAHETDWLDNPTKALYLDGVVISTGDEGNGFPA